jgi:hypothetical protein
MMMMVVIETKRSWMMREVIMMSMNDLEERWNAGAGYELEPNLREHVKSARRNEMPVAVQNAGSATHNFRVESEITSNGGKLTRMSPRPRSRPVTSTREPSNVVSVSLMMTWAPG